VPELQLVCRNYNSHDSLTIEDSHRDEHLNGESHKYHQSGYEGGDDQGTGAHT